MSPLTAFLAWSVPLAARGILRDSRAEPEPTVAPDARRPRTPPPDWDLWRAKDKVTWMNENMDIGRDGSNPTWQIDYDNTRHCMNAECIYPGGQLDRKDVVEPYQCRMEGAHPDGIVGWIKVIWDDGQNNYTGLFKENVDHGLFRVGYQGYPGVVEEAISNAERCQSKTRDQKQCDEIRNSSIHPWDLPSMFVGLKFFRDHVPSGNIHLMGTGDMDDVSWSLLSKVYTNQVQGVGVPENETQENPFLTLSAQAPFRGTRWPGFNGLYDLAMFDQGGKLEKNIRLPYQLFLAPTDKSISALPRECIGDLVSTRKRLNQRIRPGDMIWDVLVKDTLLAPLRRIGQIELQSRFMTSADLDRQIFFPHTRFERDIELRPEFTSDEYLGCKDYYHCFSCPQHPYFCFPSSELIQWWASYRNNPTELLEEESPVSQLSPLSQQNSVRIGGHSVKPITKAMPCMFTKGLKKLKSRKSEKVHSSEDSMLATDVPVAPDSRPPVDLPVVYPPVSLSTKPEGEDHSSGDEGDPDPRLPPEDDDNPNGEEEGGEEEGPYGEGIYDIDEATGYLYALWAQCPEQRCDTCWPRHQREWPHGTNCSTTQVSGREHAELEYRIDADCEFKPYCSNDDGTWYSQVYPCRCGSLTCSPGQVCKVELRCDDNGRNCNERCSSCKNWGPYADATVNSSTTCH